MKNKPKKKKRIVEIYFVLYLAALVLLIPGRDEEIQDAENMQRSSKLLPFELKPEKTNLSCEFLLDSNGINIITIDSINKIYYTGDPDDIDFEFIVEDKAYQQEVSIRPEQNKSEFFNVKTNKKEQYARFSWKPPFTDKINKSYLVTVVAHFEKDDSKITKKTQFNLNKNFINTKRFELVRDTLEDDTSGEQSEVKNFRDYSRDLEISELNLIPREYNIRTIAYKTWKNVINVTGLNLKSDLLKNPDINLKRDPEENGGTAYIEEINESKLILEGTAPAYGSMQVTIKLTRQIDGSEGSVSFSVLPQPVGMPEYPKKMYPGIEYTFEPNLPVLSGQKTSALLKTSNGEILAQSDNGYKFTYIPDDSEVHQEVLFERYIDDKKFGQSYKIKIKDFSKPEFSRIQKINDNTLRVFTLSYGLHQGEENYVPELKIKGNAKSTEIIGQARFNEEELVYTQVFEIKPKNPAEKFEFNARAVNVKGQKSEFLHYPEK